jgi:hypothetical protein
MAVTKTADIYINARRKKNKPKNQSRPEKTKKTGSAAAEKTACQGRPAGGGADGGSYWPFGPGFRGAYSFSFFGEQGAGNRGRGCGAG